MRVLRWILSRGRSIWRMRQVEYEEFDVGRSEPAGYMRRGEMV